MGCALSICRLVSKEENIMSKLVIPLFLHVWSKGEENNDEEHFNIIDDRTIEVKSSTSKCDKKFHFSQIFTGDTNLDLFDEAVRPCLSHFINGGTCFLFVNGKIGSGKMCVNYRN